jgi:hypothetical protein
VNGKTWGHIGGHLIVMIVGPVIFWGIGSLTMLLTKKLTAGRQPRSSTAGAKILTIEWIQNVPYEHDGKHSFSQA